MEDDIRKIMNRLRKMKDLENDFMYIKESFKQGKKIALCCVITDQNDKTTDRLYLISDDIEGARILGETELWKKDLIDNFVFGKGEMDYYTDYGGSGDDR